MPIIRPFRAIRPAADKVHLVVSRSYISYDHDGLTHKLASNPYSFIHVINPDHGHEETAKHGSKKFFKKVREKYLEFYKKGYFVQDEAPLFYIYQQKSDEREFTGLICATASLDYAEGRIKRHELTLAKREKMFTKYLKITGINAEPVLLTYRDDEVSQQLFEQAKQSDPICDFSTTDMFRHTLWAVEDAEDQATLKHVFAEKKNFYIADGHHRCASSARLTDQLNDGEASLQSPHDFFLSYLVPASQMHIEAFHRVLRLDGELDPDEILDSLGESFEVESIEKMTMPNGHGEMCISILGEAYRLRSKEPQLDVLDVELCSEKILEPIFDIVDLRNDKRISFLSGNDGVKGIEKALKEEGVDVLIALFPTQVKEIFDVADRGETMPPKSTWVEPKLRSALTMFSLTKD